LVTLIRLANRDRLLSRSWGPDRLEVRTLVAGSYNNRDTILDEIVDFTADRVRPIGRKVGGHREIQNLYAKFSEALACVDDLVHIPVCTYAVLRNHDVRSRSDTRDQPHDACLVTDRVIDIRAYKAERIDGAVREVRMREIDPGADNADPNTFP
jgi:hypothetical protein